MSERRRSAAALSSRAHAFSVEALIGSNKKRKLRGWEEKELELSMESLGTDGEDAAHCLDMDPDSEASPGSDGEGLAERTSCSFGSPADLAPGPCEPSPPASMEEIQMELQCADLWKRFHDIGTEMIITKAGRRMFPAMRVKIAGLDPHQQYYIAMDIVPVDNKRYRLLCFYIFLEIHRYSHHLHQCTAALKKKKSGQKSACAGAELTHDGSLWICNKTDNPANGAGP
uniref:T-box transcription factor 15 n=1 Tax=Cynoglossus semilaevis TaxID=244447 RepID=A0A3P8VJQ7_CYNSE